LDDSASKVNPLVRHVQCADQGILSWGEFQCSPHKKDRSLRQLLHGIRAGAGEGCDLL